MIDEVRTADEWISAGATLKHGRLGKVHFELNSEVIAKSCSKCKQIKSLESYSPDKRATDGRQSSCRSCQYGLKEYPVDESWLIKAQEIGGILKTNLSGTAYVESEGGVVSKVCSNCKIMKNLNDFHKNRHGTFGRNTICAQCKKKKIEFSPAILKMANKLGGTPNVNNTGVEYVEIDGLVVMKICKGCKELKKMDFFSPSKVSLGNTKSKCKNCQNEKMRKEYKQNPENRKVQSQKWKEKNEEKNKRGKLKWYRSNREKELNRMKLYREENTEVFKGWWQRNREKTRVYKERRLARKRSLPDDLTENQYKEILEYFGYECALTGQKKDIHMDHVIPLSTGHGGTTCNNIIPLFGSVNQSKNNNNIFEWFELNGARFNIDNCKFDALIAYLAEVNNMTVEEYKAYVFWCHSNPVEFSGT
jgi:5-methylcytosine-specific restriction endonuclease McrA